MSNVAICFFSKDRVELTRRTVEPLLAQQEYDLFWFDGSKTDEAIKLCNSYKDLVYYRPSIYGGADTAVCYALDKIIHFRAEVLLRHDPRAYYDYIGLVENDVLLPTDWFDQTFALFERGAKDGLKVGAVSTRCYQDRILAQRDGYALMHNLGWGTQILTREAAIFTLRNMRTGWTIDNRRIFSTLSGDDIGKWWAFKNFEHNLGPDWHNDAMLAAHGLASLALTPSPVEMIGQDPSLAQQGLTIVTKPEVHPSDPRRFETFAARSAQVRDKNLRLPDYTFWRGPDNSSTIFAHQLGLLGAAWIGDWALKWAPAFGPFAWIAKEAGAKLRIPVLGPCSLLMTGGAAGASWKVAGSVRTLPPENQLLWIDLPDNGVSYREIEAEAITPGGVIYGLRVRDDQPRIFYEFDWDKLPRIEG